jgi:hypothetical protein
MSELLRDTVDYLRAQLSKIDLRLTDLDAERVKLTSARAMIAAVLDGEAESKSGVGHAQLTEAPAGRATSPASIHGTGVHSGESLMYARRRTETDAKPANKAARAILLVLAATSEPLTVKQLLAGTKQVTKPELKYQISRLVDAGEIIRTGRTHATRYSLPTGRAKRSAAPGNGKGSPADDDAHGAVRVVTSAGDAGVTPAPGEATSLQPPVLRPPASTEVTTMDVLDDDEPCDALAADADRDGFGDVFDEPPYRAPIRRPDLRQPRTGPAAAAKTTTARESFWLRPDADWQAEAQRMRNDPKAMCPGKTTSSVRSGRATAAEGPGNDNHRSLSLEPARGAPHPRGGARCRDRLRDAHPRALFDSPMIAADQLLAAHVPSLKSWTCPFCFGIGGSCCRCAGRGRLAFLSTVISVMAQIWARPGCPCEACRAAGNGPRANRKEKS